MIDNNQYKLNNIPGKGKSTILLKLESKKSIRSIIDEQVKKQFEYTRSVVPKKGLYCEPEFYGEFESINGELSEDGVTDFVENWSSYDEYAVVAHNQGILDGLRLAMRLIDVEEEGNIEDNCKDQDLCANNDILEYPMVLIEMFEEHFGEKGLYDGVCHFTYDEDTNEFFIVSLFSDGQPNFDAILVSHDSLNADEKKLPSDILYMTFIQKVNKELELII